MRSKRPRRITRTSVDGSQCAVRQSRGCLMVPTQGGEFEICQCGRKVRLRASEMRSTGSGPGDTPPRGTAPSEGNAPPKRPREGSQTGRILALVEVRGPDGACLHDFLAMKPRIAQYNARVKELADAGLIWGEPCTLHNHTNKRTRRFYAKGVRRDGADV